MTPGHNDRHTDMTDNDTTGALDGECSSTEVRHIGVLTASEHDLHGRGPVGHLSTRHSGKVDAEVFVGSGVWIGVESEETALASSGVRFTAEGARQLAALLHEAADTVEQRRGDE
jgi:hypothetical protein